MMKRELKELLQILAIQYETPEFILNDPIQIPRQYSNLVDIEVSALITSWIATGNRKQIIKTASSVDLDLFKKTPYLYILEQKWRKYKGKSESFYRFYSFNDFFTLCDALFSIYDEYDSLENYLKLSFNELSPLHGLQSTFGHINGIPEVKSSSEAKKLCMFLRWMVRRNSPVDIGAWQSFDPQYLIIPLDTHVYRLAKENWQLISGSKCMKTACELTEQLCEVWPNDPAKGDFAIFGYGVNQTRGERLLELQK